MAAGRTPPSDRRRNKGFTYLGALFLIMLLGLMLSAAFQTWSLANQRAREKELLWVGTQYAKALQAYYLQSPGKRQYPAKLEDLIEDKRFPSPRRYLRRLYFDPVTRSDEWGIIKTPDNRIAGVYSKSETEPWKKAKFPLRWDDFKEKKKYSEWRFVADPAVAGDARPGTGSTGVTDPLATPMPTPQTAQPGGPL